MTLFKRKFKFNLTKFLSCLRMAEIRTRQCKNKTDNSIPCQISGIKADLQKKSIDDAQIKAEVLIKNERLSVALDELDNILLEVIEKASLLIDPSSIPDDFLATLAALLYAIPRIKELDNIRKHLRAKLGKEFVREAMGGARVDPLIAEKFRLDVPPSILVGDYLENIATTQKRPLELDLPSVPAERVSMKTTAPKFPEIPAHPIKVDECVMVEESVYKLTKDGKRNGVGVNDELPSFEELSKRFDELKQNNAKI